MSLYAFGLGKGWWVVCDGYAPTGSCTTLQHITPQFSKHRIPSRHTRTRTHARTVGLKYSTNMFALRARKGLTDHIVDTYCSGTNFYKATQLPLSKASTVLVALRRGR